MIPDFKVKVTPSQSVEIQELLLQLGTVDRVIDSIYDLEYLYYRDQVLTWGFSNNSYNDANYPEYSFVSLKYELLNLIEGRTMLRSDLIPNFKVRILDRDQSIQIQRLVFQLGGKWRIGHTDESYFEEYALYYNQSLGLTRSLFNVGFEEYEETEYQFNDLVQMLSSALIIQSEGQYNSSIPEFKIHVDREESAEIQRLLAQLGVTWDANSSIFPGRKYLYYRHDYPNYGFSWGMDQWWYDEQNKPEFSFEDLRNILSSLIYRNNLNAIEGNYNLTASTPAVNFVVDGGENIQYSTFSKLPKPSKNAGYGDWGRDADKIIGDLRRWLHL